ncbi:hypothetical protein B4U79_15652 [Dinothrombium tinctorium]|uniref:Uncharacterized protein n=1 Tax=Dinothrombium tinctorium TaxID=1965070 RepID=A0A443Q7H2_9ACAR|nr:hypothetical protein B4U79_15652 [Dinothrombium tinctorium]
MIVITYFVN